jgi:hypothetical protein
MPLWAIVLTLIFSALSLIGSGVGALVHVRLSARNSGRLEQKVDGLVDDLGRQRETIGGCQLAEHCEQQMEQMGERVKSAHRRMDRQDERLDKHDDVIRDLGLLVGALKGKA